MTNRITSQAFSQEENLVYSVFFYSACVDFKQQIWPELQKLVDHGVGSFERDTFASHLSQDQQSETARQAKFLLHCLSLGCKLLIWFKNTVLRPNSPLGVLGGGV